MKCLISLGEVLLVRDSKKIKINQCILWFAGGLLIRCRYSTYRPTYNLQPLSLSLFLFFLCLPLFTSKIKKKEKENSKTKNLINNELLSKHKQIFAPFRVLLHIFSTFILNLLFYSFIKFKVFLHQHLVRYVL